VTGAPDSRQCSAAAQADFGAVISCLMNSILRWCGLLVAAVVLSGCSYGQDVAAAEAAIVRFRQMMTDRQFSQIYLEGADELKKATTEQNMTRLLAAVDRKLGAVKVANKNGSNVHYSPSGVVVTINFKTEFEKGNGEERFVYRIAGEKALLQGYHINSLALIAD
jgi:hypothetical protein